MKHFIFSFYFHLFIILTGATAFAKKDYNQLSTTISRAINMHGIDQIGSWSK